MGRQRPNILVTGTPGTGKTSTCTLLGDQLHFRHVDVGEVVKQKSLYDGWDEELQSYILNEDLLCDELEEMLEDGGNIVDYHGCGFFPERWFDLVVVLQTDNGVLYDRLTNRNTQTSTTMNKSGNFQGRANKKPLLFKAEKLPRNLEDVCPPQDSMRQQATFFWINSY